MFVVFLLILTDFSYSSEFNIDLIFSLQQHFQSSLILFEKRLDNEKIVKKFLGYQESRPQAFIGLLDLNDNCKSFISRKKNDLVIFDDESNFIEKVIKIQNMNSNIMTSFTWIYFMNTSDAAQNLNSLNIPYNSKFFLVQEINFDRFEITEVYQVSSGSPKINSRYAVWEKKELNLVKRANLFSRINLQGYEMKLIGIPVHAGILKKYPHWDLLSDSMNMTVTKILVEDMGFSFKNGTKTGVFELVYNNPVDGSFNAFVMSADRMNDYDFIFPIGITHAKLYVEVKQRLNWKSFVTPFCANIWISIIVWIISAYFLMNITNRMISPLFKYRFEDPIFNFIRAFSNQGREIRPTRFIFYFCMLMPYILGIVLLQHYSADLLSHLTVRDFTPPFRNLKEVIDDGSYEIAALYPSYNWEILSMNVGNRKRRLVPFGYDMGTSGEFFHDLCKYRRVVITETVNFNVYVNCTVVELPEPINSRTQGIMVKKGFPYREAMTKLYRRFQAIGRAQLYLKNIVKERTRDYAIEPVELNLVFPLFLLLIGFICLSIAMFILEVIVWSRKKKQERVRRRIANKKIIDDESWDD